LLLIHQIPPNPAYLRVKIWRRLQAMGAVAIKNSVYVVPRNEETREDFEWLAREIVEGGGDASICEARFVEGLTDDHVEALFQAGGESDYRHLRDEAGGVAGGGRRGKGRIVAETNVPRLRQRLAAVAEIDFFGAPGREVAEGFVAELEHLVEPREGA